MFTDKIKTLVIIIGHEVCNIKPYAINDNAPREFNDLKVFMFFIKNEIISVTEAKYPTHSV